MAAKSRHRPTAHEVWAWLQDLGGLRRGADAATWLVLVFHSVVRAAPTRSVPGDWTTLARRPDLANLVELDELHVQVPCLLLGPLRATRAQWLGPSRVLHVLDATICGFARIGEPPKRGKDVTDTAFAWNVADLGGVRARVPVPLPSDKEVKLVPPDEEEAAVLARGIVGAVTPPDGLTELQRILLRAIFVEMTGVRVDPDQVKSMGPGEFAVALARRNEIFRTRIVQVMLIAALILVPLPEDVAERVTRYAAELGVDEGMLAVARRYSRGSLGLALIDFNRNGYTATWNPEEATNLHTSAALDEAWQEVSDDPALAARWAALGRSPPGSLGRRVFEFYQARGFTFPGLSASAPPYLAQHDWVHVLADYGTTVENELEVFALIARAIPDPRGFSLLAMVIGLFETGYLKQAAGLFHYDRGHLSRAGMADRLADAWRRGALCGRDLMDVDWFEHADRPVDDVRAEFGIEPKSDAAIAAGSVGPWQPGGISPFQLQAGRRLADADGREYDSYGATSQ